MVDWTPALRRVATVAKFFTPRVSYIYGPSWSAGGVDLAGYVNGLSPADLWRTQPNFRTVVDFLARNVAQLGVHVYHKDDDGGRSRVSGTPLTKLLEDVDGEMTTYDLLYATIGDFLLYDVAYWWVHKAADTRSGWTLRRMPPAWVSPSAEHATPFRVSAYDVHIADGVYKVPAIGEGSDGGGIIRMGGYSPDNYLGGSPKVLALKDTLQEQLEAAQYRKDVWKRGGRVSSVLERPADAEPWSDTAREAFRKDWYAKFTGRGPGAGGTPILEDGMKLSRIDFNAREQQFVEAAQLALQTVAAAFHVSPTMLGYSEGATYANVQAYSRMLYTDTLGPTIKQLTQRMNRHLVGLLSGEDSGDYIELNIAEKMSGSFEEQAAVLSSSVGAPWMTPNEARARQNLPAIDGGDQLVVPLNVTVGGQANPTDTGSQNVNPSAPDRANYNAAPPPKVKSARKRDAATDEVAEVLLDFFKRQGHVLKSKGAKSTKALKWDAERWDGELTEDLYAVSRKQATTAAVATLKANGVDTDAYNEARTLAYLRESSARKAEAINATTREALDEALEEDDPDTDPYTKVFEEHAEGRAHVWGATVAGFVVGFGMMEAARQTGGRGATKTWVVTSANPRASHASMDGETVPVGDTFSNGLDWPGSFGDPDEVSGCQCEVTVSW